MVTTHGRFSPWFHGKIVNYLAHDTFLEAQRGFYRDGFRYAAYPNATEVFDQDTYGISLSSTAFVAEVIEAAPSVRLVSIMERGWDGHQDVVVFRKSPIFN